MSSREEKEPASQKGYRKQRIKLTEATKNAPETADTLTERRKELLKIIIQEFVNTATPVSSEVIVNKYRLPISPATVRNEMAELEREGYITHPHTSAGRIPSDKGYRYFVEHLMPRPIGLTVPEQRMIQHQFYQIQLELNEWLRLAASITARTAQNAAVVSAPRAYDNRLKRLELIEVQERLALLIIVTQDGTIKEQMVVLEEPHSQEALSVISARLNTQLNSQNWNQIESRIKEWPEDTARQIAGRLVEGLRALDLHQNSQIYRDGLTNILSQPEFSDISRVRQVLQTLESGTAFTAIIPEVLSADNAGVQVIIGGENRHDDLRLLSVVLARYGIDGQVAGVVGIVGPTRMEYGRSISTVQYVSQLLSSLITERRG
jgi:heat-inducible transcriptional repressor